MDRHINREQLAAFEHHLRMEEREAGTIEKYLRDIRAFAAWLDKRPLDKGAVMAWKEHLLTAGYAPSTVNSMLIAANQFFRFQGWDELRVKTIRIQRQIFRSRDKELTKEEYTRLLDAAQDMGKERLALLMETICATGVRVSEVKYITVKSAMEGRADISLKGKIRTILLSGKLCRKLLRYDKKKKIVSGERFLTRDGKALTRYQIWREMKKLYAKAGVQPTKVFPHNLRHLFAATFYRVTHDIVKLADVLGHSSINTTRIYLLTTGTEHSRQLKCLGLVQ